MFFFSLIYTLFNNRDPSETFFKAWWIPCINMIVIIIIIVKILVSIVVAN